MLMSKYDFYKCKMAKLVIYSYLEGYELYHKIALLNKATR